MKKIMFATLGFAFAFAANAAYTDWKYSSYDEPWFNVEFNFNDDTSSIFPVAYNAEYDEVLEILDAESSKMTESAKNAFKIAVGAMAAAIIADRDALLALQYTDNLSASMEALFGATTGEIQHEGNVVSSYKQDTEIRSKVVGNRDKIIGNAIGAEVEDLDKIKPTVLTFGYDSREFNQRIDDGSSKQQLLNYNTLTGDGEGTGVFYQDVAKDCYIPMTFGGNNSLKWLWWSGFSPTLFSSLSATLSTPVPMEIKGWSATQSDGCIESVSKFMSNPDLAGEASKHKILTKYIGDDNSPKVHWLSIGDALALGSTYADDLTVTTNTEFGAVSGGVLSLVGYATDTEDASDTEPHIPICYGTDGGLSWEAFKNRFNPNVFTTDDDGYIILNGVEDAEEDDIMVVSAKGAGADQSVKVVRLSGGSFETSATDGIEIKGQGDIHEDNLWEAEPPFEVLTKDDDGVLHWLVNNGLNPRYFTTDDDGQLIIAGDDCRDYLNTMLHDPHDAENRNAHRFLARYDKGDEHKMHWVGISDVLDFKVDIDGHSVTTTGTDRVGMMAITGFAENTGTANDPAVPVATGKNNDMAFKPVSEIFNQGVFVVREGGVVGLRANGGDGGKILTITGDDAEQSLSANGFDGTSIVLDGSDYQVSNFRTATKPVAGGGNFAEMMTNLNVMTTGYSVMLRAQGTDHPSIVYADLGKFKGIVNSSVAIATDDKSCTTNSALGAINDGVLSAYGFANAVQDAQENDGCALLPMVGKGEDSLSWGNALSVFSGRAFQFDTNGKIILNGMDEGEEGSIDVITIDRSGESPVVTKKSFDSSVFTTDDGHGITMKHFYATDTGVDLHSLVAGIGEERSNYGIIGRVNQEGDYTPTVIPIGDPICPPVPSEGQSGAWLATRTENGLGWINFNPAADNICSNLWAALYYDLHDNAPAFDGNAQRILFIPDKFIDGCSLANFDHELPSEGLPIFKRYLGLYGWEDPEEDERDLALCLTNNDVYAEGLKVLVRDENSDDLLGRPVLRYLDIGHLVQSKEKQGDIVDWKSTSTNQDGRVEIFGFHELTALDNGRFPVKNGNAITWVSTNEFAGASAVKFDGVSVYTNDAEEVMLKNYDTASAGMIPFKSDSGELDWISTNEFVNVAGAVKVDKASITTNSQGVARLYGFDTAFTNEVPMVVKDEQGNRHLEWTSIGEVSTNLVLYAGAGINITKNADKTLTISAKPVEEESLSTKTVTVVTNVRYDDTTHKFQAKTRTLHFVGTLEAESDWQDVFTATSHKGEHE